MAAVVNINDVLDGHVALEVDCVDRLYLNAYVPSLQVSGQVKRFLEEHLGNPIAVTGDHREDRQPVPPRREGVRRDQHGSRCWR